jgi:hypothetical protein
LDEPAGLDLLQLAGAAHLTPAPVAARRRRQGRAVTSAVAGERSILNPNEADMNDAISHEEHGNRGIFFMERDGHALPR